MTMPIDLEYLLVRFLSYVH